MHTCPQSAINQGWEPLRLLVPIRAPCDKFIILCLISRATVRLMSYLLSKGTVLLCKLYLTQTEDLKTKAVWSRSPRAERSLQRLSQPVSSPLSSNLLQVESLLLKAFKSY